MLGGGTFVKQDKVLPGSYINFVSAAKSAAMLSERGIAAVPMAMSWGPEGTVLKITREEFEKNSLRLMGYDYTDKKMLPFRELFKNASMIYVYRLNAAPVKAACDLAAAAYGGVRGNDIRLVVKANGEDSSKFDVMTYLNSTLCDEQTVAAASELKDNEWVSFKKEAELAASAGIPLVGGTDGTEVTEESYQVFMDKMEKYAFHCLVCSSTDESVKALFTSYTKRMRDEAGAKFQTVMYQAGSADYEGIISVENKSEGAGESGLVYWAAGAQAACPVNKSNTNKLYDGELEVNTDYTQKQLSDGILSGKLLFHLVGDEVRVLEDVNTLVGYTDEKGTDFSSNQTIRVLDQIGNDLAAMFYKKYMGVMPNDESGRISLWNDIVTYLKELVKIRAIEEFIAKDITVSGGETKKSVVAVCPVTPISCMSQLYMTCIIH